MIKGKKLSRQQEDAILDRYLSGEFLEEICIKFDISKTTLARIRKRRKCKALSVLKRKMKPYDGDLIGKTFGKLTIGDLRVKDGVAGRRWVAVCKCSCGKEGIERLPGVLLRGESKSCGCGRNEIRKYGSANPAFKGAGDISGGRWSIYRCQARKRKLSFNINAAYGWKLFLAQKGRCVLTGLDLSFPKTSHGAATASLDRIDSSKGYVKSNVQWVHRDINLMKRDFDEGWFKHLCSLVSAKAA